MKRDFNWCATKTDVNGQMSHWGLCDSDSEIPDCTNEDSKDLGIYYNIYNDLTNFILWKMHFFSIFWFHVFF